MNDYLDFLTPNKLCAGLSLLEISNLMSFISTKTYIPGQNICVEGEIAKEIYFIVEGEVEIIKVDGKTQESYPITTLTSGAIIGEISLLNQHPRSATMTALTPVTLLVLTFNDLYQLKESELINNQIIYYKIVENMANELSGRLTETTQLLSALLRDKKIEKEVRTAKLTLFSGFFSV